MAAVKDTQAVSPMTLARALVRERMETADGRSFAEIVDLIIDDGLPDDCVRALLRSALMDLAQHINRASRGSMTGQSRGSRKWDKVREQVAQHPDVFQTSWPTETGLKLLGDFTKADAVWAHNNFMERARGSAASADKFAKLAKILPEGKTAHALDRERVEAIFDA